MNAATNQPSILTLRLGQSDQAGHLRDGGYLVELLGSQLGPNVLAA